MTRTEQVAKLRQSGLSVQQIMIDTGMSANRVYRYIYTARAKGLLPKAQ